MPILFTKIQFHDHPAAFTVAEFFLAVAAEFSFRFRYIAVQRFLQFLRDTAPRNDITHAGIPHIHDAGSLTILIRQNQVHQKHIRKRCPLILCLLPSALCPKLVQCLIQVIFCQRGLVQQDMQLLLHRWQGLCRPRDAYTITDKHPKNRNPAAKPIPVNSFLKKTISHTSFGYSLA